MWGKTPEEGSQCVLKLLISNPTEAEAGLDLCELGIYGQKSDGIFLNGWRGSLHPGCLCAGGTGTQPPQPGQGGRKSFLGNPREMQEWERAPAPLRSL